MSAFDEWFSSKFELVNKVVTDNEHHPATTFKRNMGFSFEAGAQSRQAEIDELQKRIDETINAIESNRGVITTKKLINILKGEEDEQ